MLWYLYIFGNRDIGIYKIGISGWPEDRLKKLDSILPFELKAIESRLVPEQVNPYALEDTIHNHLASRKIRKEWFKLSDKQLAEAIKFIDRLYEPIRQLKLHYK